MPRTLAILALFTALSRVAAAAPELSFEKDVRPILKAHCFHCHGEDRTKGGLDVRLVSLLLDGGGTGPAIVPGKPSDSLLLDLVHKGEMPKKGKRLTPQEVPTIERCTPTAPTPGSTATPSSAPPNPTSRGTSSSRNSSPATKCSARRPSTHTRPSPPRTPTDSSPPASSAWRPTPPRPTTPKSPATRPS